MGEGGTEDAGRSASMGHSQRRHSDRREVPLIRPVVEPFDRFIHAESSGGLLLLGATVVAMVWANSPWVSWRDCVWGNRSASSSLRGLHCGWDSSQCLKGSRGDSWQASV
ncbi:MAG: hypothetical protein GDA68_22570 [Nitrospira sp. CR2.1]|nr:hypothetical protein [Nitrospira sp. CR2.1]